MLDFNYCIVSSDTSRVLFNAKTLERVCVWDNDRHQSEPWDFADKTARFTLDQESMEKEFGEDFGWADMIHVAFRNTKDWE